jgi:AraC family transcriptional regulator
MMEQTMSRAVKKLNAKIIEKPAFTVVGMMVRAKPGDPSMMQLWLDFDDQLERIPNKIEPGVFYGVVDNFDTDTQEFDYLASVEIPAGQAAPEGMATWAVPAQTYAVFETTLPQIGRAYETIYGTWLPGSDFERANAPEFEYYGTEFEPSDPNSKMSVWIPVKQK